MPGAGTAVWLPADAVLLGHTMQHPFAALYATAGPAWDAAAQATGGRACTWLAKQLANGTPSDMQRARSVKPWPVSCTASSTSAGRAVGVESKGQAGLERTALPGCAQARAGGKEVGRSAPAVDGRRACSKSCPAAACSPPACIRQVWRQRQSTGATHDWNAPVLRAWRGPSGFFSGVV